MDIEVVLHEHDLVGRGKMRPYVARATSEVRLVLGPFLWQEGNTGSRAAGCHGATLSALRRGALAQRSEGHAHVGWRGRGCVSAPALARDRRQAGLSWLRLHDLLRLPAVGRPAALAL